MAEIQPCFIQTASPNPQTGDPGQIEVGWFRVDGSRDLVMTDEDGKPLAKPMRLGPDDDAQIVAMRLLRERWARTDDGANSFNKKLHYPRTGWR